MKEKEITLLDLSVLPITLSRGNEGNINYIIEDWSSFGEDVFIEGSIQATEENTVKAIRDQVQEEINNFDIDEYVEMWSESRGSKGVPESYKDLIAAGESSQEMRKKWLKELERLCK